MDCGYKELLVEIAREITREDLETMRFLCDDVLTSEAQTTSQSNLYIEVLHFFRDLRNAGKVSDKNLTFLQVLLKKAKREDLALKVDEFPSVQSRRVKSGSGPASCKAARPLEENEKEAKEGSWTTDSPSQVLTKTDNKADVDSKAKKRREKKKRYKKRRRHEEGIQNNIPVSSSNKNLKNEATGLELHQNPNNEVQSWATVMSNISKDPNAYDLVPELISKEDLKNRTAMPTGTVYKDARNEEPRPNYCNKPKNEVPGPSFLKSRKDEVSYPKFLSEETKNETTEPTFCKNPKNEVVRSQVYNENAKNGLKTPYFQKDASEKNLRPNLHKNPMNKATGPKACKDSVCEAPGTQMESKDDASWAQFLKDSKENVTTQSFPKDPKNEVPGPKSFSEASNELQTPTFENDARKMDLRPNVYKGPKSEEPGQTKNTQNIHNDPKNVIQRQKFHEFLDNKKPRSDFHKDLQSEALRPRQFHKDSNNVVSIPVFNEDKLAAPCFNKSQENDLQKSRYYRNPKEPVNGEQESSPLLNQERKDTKEAHNKGSSNYIRMTNPSRNVIHKVFKPLCGNPSDINKEPVKSSQKLNTDVSKPSFHKSKACSPISHKPAKYKDSKPAVLANEILKQYNFQKEGSESTEINNQPATFSKATNDHLKVDHNNPRSGSSQLKYTNQKAVSKSAQDGKQKRPDINESFTELQEQSRCILFLCNNWCSWGESIPVLNRQLCFALAREGHHVACLVLTSSDVEREEARKGGVELLPCPDKSGINEDDPQLFQFHDPTTLPFTPDVVVGHGKATGPAALFYSENISCPRLHVIHDLPDECLKYDEVIDRQYNEKELARDAKFLAAIGTLLHEKWSTILNRADIIEVIPGLPDLNTRNRILSPQNRYFVPAKFCSPQSSGLGIAISAVNKSSSRDIPPRKPTFIPRNTHSKGSTKPASELLSELNKTYVELYRNDKAKRNQVLIDLQGATLFLSPARTEAFGVSALDAIAMGIPIVISSRSGLAYTIRKHLQEEFHYCIKDVLSECSDNVGDEVEDDDACVWANEIDKASLQREQAFAKAEALQSNWNKLFTWQNTAKHIMDTMERSGKLSPFSSSQIMIGNNRISDSTLALVGSLNLFNKRQKVVLFISPAKQLSPKVYHFGLVQWAAVFDFSREESGKNSYLKICENFLANIGRPACRLYPPSEEESRKQRPNMNLPNGTPWILLQGSLPDMPRDIEENLDWIQEILNQMKKRYPCRMILLIVWESSEENRSLCRKLSKVLTIIQALPSWKNAIEVVIVATTKMNDCRLDDIAYEFNIKINCVKLSEFCQAIQSTAIGNPWCDVNTDFSLPRLNPSTEKVVSTVLPDSIKWVDSVIEVLYTSIGHTPEFGKEDAFHFLRGGQISWYGIEMDYVLRRESWKTIQKAIESELEYPGAAFLTLFHQRGTGGTTSARKLLYDFHLRYPCICLKAINYDTFSAIKVLWEFCGLPVLILADIKDVPGAITNDVEALYGSLSNDKISCLILHVMHRQNYSSQSRKNEQNSKEPLVLARTLTDVERENFYEAYSLQSESKRPQLGRLRHSDDEVLQSPFYYGLVAFGEEFKGLEPFVKDCLRGLKNVQRQALCFISMSYHYAQVQIPLAALAPIFNLKPRQLQSIDDLLTPDAMELLIEEGYGCWRPRHYSIGKEIISQILTLPLNISRENWKSHLADKVIEFIEFMEEDLVTAILLNRISDENTFKRFSTLVEDIPDGKDVIRVFKTAIKIHPDNPFFKAHLGRYYSVVMGTDGFEDAIKRTDEGILLASSYSQNVRSQLTQMKGIVYKRQVRNKIESSAPLEEIIPIAQEGISAFTRAVSITAENLEGAIIPQVRMMCDIFKYVNRIFEGGIFAYVLSDNASPFLRDGISEASDILEMVTESRYYPDLRRELFKLGGRRRSKEENKEDLIKYFKELKKTNKTSTASVNRQIVLIEFELCKENKTPISKIADEMIKLLEEALKYDEKIDLTMRLWVRVAPHIPETLISAESKIAAWCSKGKSVTSYLYRYIIACIRILEGGRDQQHEDDRLIALDELNKAVIATKRYLRHPDRPVVFLGTAKGMGQLVSPEPETVKPARKQRSIPEGYDRQLRYLTGTIASLGKKVGDIKVQGLTISFRADLCQPPLVGSSNLGKKVKFYLAFNYFGADAYDVRITAC